MEMPARGNAAFRATIRFASAPTIRCCAAVGGSAALRMRHTPCGCRSADLVGVQANIRLPRHSSMRRAQQCRYFASSLPPSKRHSRLTTVRRGCCQVRLAGIHGEAMYTAPDCAARAAIQATNCQCRGSGGPPLAFLWGIQRGYSLRKENTPFGVAARTPLSLPRLRGKRCSPFGLAFPPRGARNAPAPLRAQKKSTLRVLFFKSLRISRTGTSGRLRR